MTEPKKLENDGLPPWPRMNREIITPAACLLVAIIAIAVLIAYPPVDRPHAIIPPDLAGWDVRR